jgi:hypothetical protein
MTRGDKMLERKKYTFGTCAYSRTSPANVVPGTKAVNILFSFEEALKLNEDKV